MFNRNQIQTMISKHKAQCLCAQCDSEFICNIYDAAKSQVGHLCHTCKIQITSLKSFNSQDLNRVFNYNENTGKLSYAQDSVSGLKGQSAGYPHNKGYISIAIGKKEYLVHRVIWYMKTGSWPVHHIDHKDHNRRNNRWSNLREVSSRENQLNMSKRKNSTGIQGVRKLPSGKFCAYIMVNRKQISLGSYENILDAQTARKDAEVLYGFHANHGS